MKRANVMVGIGAGLVVVSLLLVWLIGRDTSSPKASEARVTVVVARADVKEGQTGDDLVSAGKVGLDRVPASQVHPGALEATADLAGTVLRNDLVKGEQVTSASVRPETLRAGSVTIPKGKEAVAVTVGFTSGAAGYAGAGDHVNIYASVSSGTASGISAPLTKLLLSDVEILDVSNEVAPRRAAEGSDGTAQARQTEGSLTLLLALTPAESERAVFASTFDQLWFTVLAKGTGASTTAGVTRASEFRTGG